ncbi:MAG: hypothetical protein WBM24_07995, partial [Candidatus Sulfotelmatobacter sp.]
AVVMTITTTASSASNAKPSIYYALWLALPALAFLGTHSRRKHRKLILPASLFALFLLGLLLSSCGGGGANGGSGGGNGGGTQQQGTQPGTYTIIVTGTSGTLSHNAATVTLVVSGSPSSTEVSGAWEFVATSATNGSTTLVEADLTADGDQFRASGPSAVQTATHVNSVWYVNGKCSSVSPGQNSVSGAVTGNAISMTFNEGGNVFTASGALSGNSASGTYSGNSPDCPDSGTFTGIQVPNLSGTFSGTLSFSNGAKDHVTATLTEGSDYSLTFQTDLAGTDNGTYIFLGSAVANVAFVSGSINGNAFQLFGYFDGSGTYTGTPNSIEVFDYNTLQTDGLLVKQ